MNTSLSAALRRACGFTMMCFVLTTVSPAVRAQEPGGDAGAAKEGADGTPPTDSTQSAPPDGQPAPDGSTGGPEAKPPDEKKVTEIVEDLAKKEEGGTGDEEPSSAGPDEDPGGNGDGAPSAPRPGQPDEGASEGERPTKPAEQAIKNLPTGVKLIRDPKGQIMKVVAGKLVPALPQDMATEAALNQIWQMNPDGSIGAPLARVLGGQPAPAPAPAPTGSSRWSIGDPNLGYGKTVGVSTVAGAGTGAVAGALGAGVPTFGIGAAPGAGAGAIGGGIIGFGTGNAVWMWNRTGGALMNRWWP